MNNIYSLITLYVFVSYGLTVLLVDGKGPYDILEKGRLFIKNHISAGLGEMFDCHLCTSTNIGWSFVVFEQLCGFTLSPVSFILSIEETNVIIIAILNAFFTAGEVWFVSTIVDLMGSVINHFNKIDYHE